LSFHYGPQSYKALDGETNAKTRETTSAEVKANVRDSTVKM